MKKATLVKATYEHSSTITHQGNRASIQAYLNKGYHIKESRNGYWVLSKPASLTVILKDYNNVVHSFQMKEDVFKYYGQSRISEKLAKTFISDANAGKVKFYMDNTGSYCIK